MGLTVIYFPIFRHTARLSKFSFFKLFHLLVRSYQVPVLLICPLALSHFLKFKVFIVGNVSMREMLTWVVTLIAVVAQEIVQRGKTF